ncbi:hypothetical protein, partial [Stenotrophomonas maltophilia]|uniref:hypothetical protein n=1 Tax=Stenotrophomonas maltophilia TaxID=40324 RepID=UPI001952FC62
RISIPDGDVRAGCGAARDQFDRADGPYPGKVGNMRPMPDSASSSLAQAEVFANLKHLSIA